MWRRSSLEITPLLSRALHITWWHALTRRREVDSGRGPESSTSWRQQHVQAVSSHKRRIRGRPQRAHSCQ
jgi:hypothetical protein